MMIHVHDGLTGISCEITSIHQENVWPLVSIYLEDAVSYVETIVRPCLGFIDPCFDT